MSTPISDDLNSSKQVTFDDSKNSVHTFFSPPKCKRNRIWYSSHELASCQADCQQSLMLWRLKNRATMDPLDPQHDDSLRGLEHFLEDTCGERGFFMYHVKRYAMERIKEAGYVNDNDLAAFVATLTEKHVERARSRAAMDELDARKFCSDDSINDLYFDTQEPHTKKERSLSGIVSALPKLFPFRLRIIGAS